jgi:hypothetical protein
MCHAPRSPLHQKKKRSLLSEISRAGRAVAENGWSQVGQQVGQWSGSRSGSSQRAYHPQQPQLALRSPWHWIGRACVTMPAGSGTWSRAGRHHAPDLRHLGSTHLQQPRSIISGPASCATIVSRRLRIRSESAWFSDSLRIGSESVMRTPCNIIFWDQPALNPSTPGGSGLQVCPGRRHLPDRADPIQAGSGGPWRH